MNNRVGISRVLNSSLPQPDVGSFFVAEEIMETKRCGCCGEFLPLCMFNKHSGRKDGLQSRCNNCRQKYREKNKVRIAEHKRQYRLANPEKMSRLAKKYRDSHKEEIKEWQRRHYEKNRETVCANVREYNKNNKEKIKERTTAYYEANREEFARKGKEYKKSHAKENRARSLVYSRISRGKLARPNHCSRCGIECKPDAHHEDYDKPLEIVWLCRGCHKKLHAKLNRQKVKGD